jgi:hypothetical protein
LVKQNKKKRAKIYISELIGRFVGALEASVRDVDTIGVRIGDMFFHKAAKTRQVRCYARYAHHCAFGWRVAPRFVVGREDTHVAAAHKLLVVHGEQRAGALQELWMKYDLDSVVSVVEQLTLSQGIKNGIDGIVNDIVSANGRQARSLNRRVHALFQLDNVLVTQDIVAGGYLALQAQLIQSLAELVLEYVHGVAQLLRNGLALEGLDVEAARARGKDQESHHGHVRLHRLEAVIETRQGLDEHVHALVGELVATGREQVQSLVQVEVVVAVEVTANEVVDLLLVDGVQILELVQSAELLHAEAVRRDHVGLSLEQVLGLVARDLRDGGENVGAVSGGAFHAVAMVDATIARLLVQVEVRQVVVEVTVAGAQVAAEQRGVCGEHRGDVQLTHARQNQANAGHPFVKVTDNVLGLAAQLMQKLFDNKTERKFKLYK